MGRLGIAILLALVWAISGEAFAFSHKTVRYPRVYGATGRPYGPTQAHYQYQKQYGRPWHGYGGITAPQSAAVGHYHVHGYPGGHFSYGHGAYYGGCGFGYGGVISSPGFAVFPTYTPLVPNVIYGYPPVLDNPLMAPFPNLTRLADPQEVNPQVINPQLPAPAGNPLPVASTPEARLKSVRAQAQGDLWFQQQEYHKAFDRYKTAVAEAGDRGEAHLRLAICYAALGHLDLAARQLKRGAAADPNIAADAKDLASIYGVNNSIAQSTMVHRATLWAKEDIRDPDRLFLLGTLLYLQGNENAPLLLETGMMLQGGGEHFQSFLAAAKTAPVKTETGSADGKGPVKPKVIKINPLNAPGGGVLPPLPAPRAE